LQGEPSDAQPPQIQGHPKLLADGADEAKYPFHMNGYIKAEMADSKAEISTY
jgi:hypothetical protein